MMHKNLLVVAMRNLINFETIIEKNDEKLLEYIDKRFKVLAIELGIEIKDGKDGSTWSSK